MALPGLSRRGVLLALASGLSVLGLPRAAWAGSYLNRAALLVNQAGADADYLRVRVTDRELARVIHKLAVARLEAAGAMEVPKEVTGGRVVLGYGVAPKPDFWTVDGKPNEPRLHVAFRADNHAQVDEFYRAALAAGGRDNGAPGPRPHYHKDYYGAFVLDPDGHNVEAVCHTRQT